MSEGDFDTIIEEYEQALANMQREYDKRGDRIEELEGQLKAICERNNVVEYANAELGEKLYGAVEDFETIADTDPDGGTEWFHEFARTTIAKIKGEQP